MKNFRLLLIVLVTICSNHYLIGQSKHIDSLLNLYKKATHDTTRCRLMLDIGQKYEEQSTDTAILWYIKAYNLAIQKRNNNEIFIIYAASAFYLIGWIECENRANYEKAIEYINQSLKLNGSLSKSRSKEIVKQAKIGISECYRLIGKVNYYQDHNDSALAYHNKAIEIFDELDDQENLMYTYNSIALVYDKQSRFDEAIEYHLKALKIAEELGDKNAILGCYGNLGIVYKHQGSYDKTIECYFKSLKIAEELGDRNVLAMIYANIGNVYTSLDSYDKALEYTNKALKIFEELGNKRAIPACYNNIGTAYINLRKYEKALENYQKALKLFEEIKNEVEISKCYNNMGNVYRKQAKHSLAMVYYLKSLKIKEKLGNKNGISHTYSNIADLYISLADSCTNAMAKTLQGSKSSLPMSQESMAYLEKALHYGNKGYQIAVEIGSIPMQDAASLRLQKAYSKLGRYKEANKFAEICIAFKDSMYSQEKAIAIEMAEKKFETEKKQLLIDKLNKEKELQNRLNVMLIAGILIILLFSVFLFRLFLQKKKANATITQKSQNLEMAFEEISSQKNEIERISGELHMVDKMKLSFFANLSHEFRTPLTLILNPAKELLEKAPYNPEYNKQLGYIYNNALKLHDLTNQIMELQKLDSGKLQLNLERFDIISYCVSMVSSFESLCIKKNNIINFKAKHSSISVLSDKDKIGKILVNLLSNSLKFCFENTAVEINIEMMGNNFNLNVVDQGVGIASEDIDKVFKRYYQAPSNMQAGGTGIGLAYVKELVGFMNGNVEISSIVDKGTTIKVTIPIEEFEVIDATCYSIDIPNNHKQDMLSEFDVEENGNENENSILIVEDNDELRVFISDLFKNDYVVYTARDGEEGISAALEYIPNIIISDVMMPKMNGFELCENLKSNEHTSHIPIILLTAKDSTESNLQGYQTGADDYIIKPFDSELLILKVKNIVATRQSIIRQFKNETDNLPNLAAYSDIDKRFMEKCIQFIEINIGNADLSVEYLAAELSFSRRNLYRKVQSLTNCNPGELIRNIRMQYALKLLKTANIRVNEVAMEVGYDNTAKFSQAFKKYHGKLPSEIKDN